VKWHPRSRTSLNRWQLQKRSKTRFLAFQLLLGLAEESKVSGAVTSRGMSTKSRPRPSSRFVFSVDPSGVYLAENPSSVRAARRAMI